MYTFRYNPVFKQWVLLGEQIPQALLLQDAHRISPRLPAAPDFQAATYPRQPFVLDAPTVKKHEEELLYTPQAPVGEYELLLHDGHRSFFTWTEKEWEGWLLLLAERTKQLHFNPYLHFLTLKLHTRALTTAGDCERVGDLIATSHPLSGMSTAMSGELVDKLLEREKLFIVHKNRTGALYVPTAPLNRREVWYLSTQESGIDQLDKDSRRGLAIVLATLFASLHEEYPSDDWVLTLHTGMAGDKNHDRWWIQVHQDLVGDSTFLPIQQFPERFVQTLTQLFAHHRVK